ncbi:MAG: hypothetical protein A2Y12_05065 [Planctomycetes bacterium GWF2_42_9]|nr:MAG: hypothetical protein A2Y12_05065 [Planctomycetes bacterium GWF2_42_9]HAL44707.1 hypothetical protein [Phycisphaerales bacterium]
MSLSVKIGEWLNPIVIKEMRQAVKGSFTSWTLMLVLAIQLVIIGCVVVLSEDIGKNFDIGPGLFTGLLAVLLFICLMFLPLFTGGRLSQEKSNSNTDLFFITTLTPVQIIRGKLFAALTVALLFFTASLPFMTLTYLLRGLDLPTIFIILAYNFILTAFSIQFCIFLGCIAGGIVSRILILLACLIPLFILFQAGIASSSGMLHKGLGSTLGTWEFWSNALTFTSVMLIVIGLLFVLSASFIAPTSANRLLGVRLYLVFTWLAAGVIAVSWFFGTGEKDYINIWLVTMVLIFGTNMIASVCEHQPVSKRIASVIPKKLIRRIPAFLFYSGPAGGVVFSAVAMTATLLVYPLLSMAGSKFNNSISVSSNETYLISIGLVFYFCCYALTSLDIKTIFFKNSISTRSTIIGIIALLIIGSIVPIVIGFLMRKNLWQELPPLWYIGNPLVLFLKKKIWVECFTFTSVWLIIVLSFSMPWFVKQFRSFRPIETDQNAS